MDTLFEDLRPAERRLFEREYEALPRERRAGRGLIVYILGRHPRTAKDWDFLARAAGEAPCLSLADCGRLPSGPPEGPDAVTLAYPALVALYQAKAACEAAPRDDPSGRAPCAMALRVARAARESRVEKAVRSGAELEAFLTARRR